MKFGLDGLLYKRMLFVVLLILLLVPNLAAQPTAESTHPPSRQKLLMLLVEFPDCLHNRTADEMQSYIPKLNDYWYNMSYGQYNLTGNAFGWYLMPHNMSDYGDEPENATLFNMDVNLPQLVRDSCAIAQKDVNFSDYDFLMIVHAGLDQSLNSTNKDYSWRSLIWSRVLWIGDLHGPFFWDNNVVIFGAAIVPETWGSEHDIFGVFAHEFGHIIGSKYGDRLGLPDLFTVDSNNTIIWEDTYSLMGTGSWYQNGTLPCDLDAWSRTYLGWLNSTTINPTDVPITITISPLELDTGIRAVKIPIINSSCYYLLENRQSIGYDTALGDGVPSLLCSFVNETESSGRGIINNITRFVYNGEYSISSSIHISVKSEGQDYIISIANRPFIIEEIFEAILLIITFALFFVVLRKRRSSKP